MKVSELKAVRTFGVTFQHGDEFMVSRAAVGTIGQVGIGPTRTMRQKRRPRGGRKTVRCLRGHQWQELHRADAGGAIAGRVVHLLVREHPGNDREDLARRGPGRTFPLMHRIRGGWELSSS